MYDNFITFIYMIQNILEVYGKFSLGGSVRCTSYKLNLLYWLISNQLHLYHAFNHLIVILSFTIQIYIFPYSITYKSNLLLVNLTNQISISNNHFIITLYFTMKSLYLISYFSDPKL